MRFLKEKSQILIISIFSVMIGGIIIFTMLFPVLSNIKGLRQTTDSYQALASAEAGLEIELYNQKIDLLGSDSDNYIDINCTSNEITNSTSSSPGGGRGQGRGFSTGRARGCRVGNRMHLDLDITTTTIANFEYLKITSIGKYGEFERTLFTGFRIATTTP